MASRGLPSRIGSEPVPFARDPFSVFRREMDQLFDNFFSPMEGRSGLMGLRANWPSVDVHESETAYTVTAELPGLEAKDVELNLRDNALTISGEKRQESKSEDGGRSWTERTYGRFERTIPFESEIDADKVEASARNGVLTITLPKNAQAREKARRIEIKPH